MILSSALAINGLLSLTPLYQTVERWIEDTVHEITAKPVRFDDLLVIDIDEQSMSNLKDTVGAWPYPRNTYEPVVNYLQAQGARTIVFDVLFSEPTKHDTTFGNSLGNGSQIWLAGRGLDQKLHTDADFFQQLDHYSWDVKFPTYADHWQDILLPTKQIISESSTGIGVGVISTLPDSDGVLRHLSLLHQIQGRILPSMALAALFQSNNPPKIQSTPGVGWISADQRRWPVDATGQVQIRIPRNPDFLPVVGFDQVLLAATGHSQAALTGNKIRGRTVFIGSSAAVLGDYVRIPIHGRIAGLGVLALFHASLAHGLVLKSPQLGLDLILILLAAALPLLYSNRRNCSEPMMAFWAFLGMSTALTLHVALFGWFGQRSDILFALQAGFIVSSIQFMARLSTLYAERRELYYAKRAADDASALKSRFLAHMTHELRTPLTAIIGYNQLLSAPQVSTDERHSQTQTIDRNCQHLLALINNLLDQAKIEAGQMKVLPAPTRVREVATEVHSALLAVANHKHVELTLTIEDGVPEVVEVDPLRLKQILYNLLGNGLKFTSEGSVNTHISWQLGEMEINVSDTGPGMDSQALSRIFDAFQQVDDTVTMRFGGTGLGLTISQNLVQLMTGHMEVDSTLGSGSTFKVVLPAPQIEPEVESELPAALPVLDDFSHMRVLVADDTVDIRDLLSVYLKRSGVQVLLAENGQQAIDLGLKEQPDLILMDMEMPIVNGPQATQALRAQGFQGVILALTAHQDSQQTQIMRDAGCDDILEKPLSRKRLLKVLSDMNTSVVIRKE